MDDKLKDAVRFLLNYVATRGDGVSAHSAQQHLANLQPPASLPAGGTMNAAAVAEERIDPDD